MARRRVRRPAKKTTKDSSKERLAQHGDEIMEALKNGEQLLESVTHYEVVKELGEGGMGTVFLAEHVSEGDIRKRVAIKVIKETHDADAIEALIQEAKITARLAHGSIVELLALESMELVLPSKRNQRTGAIEPRRDCVLYFMVLEFIDGPGLDDITDDLLQKSKLFHPALIGFLLNKSAIALSEAHDLTDEDGNSMNLVHRDISPSNILISRKAGIAKLADFGVAKAFNDFSEGEDQKMIVGKPRYMAPEQLQGDALPASDVWSLGVIGYEMLTGYSPYRVQGDDLRSVVRNLRKQHTYELRSPLEILKPTENHFSLKNLSNLIMQCMHQEPDKRPTASTISNFLERDFLYKDGIGPTNKTLAAYLELAEKINDEGKIVLTRGYDESENYDILRRTLWLDKLSGAFTKRTATTYTNDVLTALKSKESNPCLKHNRKGPYTPAV